MAGFLEQQTGESRMLNYKLKQHPPLEILARCILDCWQDEHDFSRIHAIDHFCVYGKFDTTHAAAKTLDKIALETLPDVSARLWRQEIRDAASVSYASAVVSI